jgi:sugar lactone lactonase YvrE
MRSFLITGLAAIVSGCASLRQPSELAPVKEVAVSQHQWTGITVSQEGRIFVNYPLWVDPVKFAVGELKPDGAVLPYPDKEWNAWTKKDDPATHFVCVQSVVVDDENRLWVLDPANPRFQGVVEGGPKLVQIDLEKNTVERVIRFEKPVVKDASYLNDVRVDTEQNVAYITDSGDGAIIVVDLESGKARRLLDDHFSTHSEEDRVLTIEGREWRRPDGSLPQVHADGIALSPDGTFLYYHALTADMLYRIRTGWLLNETVDDDLRGALVEPLAATEPVDGIICGPKGNIYLSCLEENAIKRYVRGGMIQDIAEDPRLAWPDTFAWGPDGYLYVTTSRIHEGVPPDAPYGIYRLKP